MASQFKSGWTERTLIESGLVDTLQIAAARKRMHRVGGTLAGALARMGLVPESRLLDLLSRRSGLPRADRERIEAPANGLLDRLPFETAYARRVLLLDEGESSLKVAISDPESLRRVAEIPAFSGVKLEACLCSERDLERAIERAYGRKASPLGPEASTSTGMRSASAHQDTDKRPEPAPEPQLPSPPESPATAREEEPAVETSELSGEESATDVVELEPEPASPPAGGEFGPSREMVTLRVLIELLEEKGVLTRAEFIEALRARTAPE